jgi:hypothetical protein
MKLRPWESRRPRIAPSSKAIAKFVCGVDALLVGFELKATEIILGECQSSPMAEDFGRKADATNRCQKALAVEKLQQLTAETGVQYSEMLGVSKKLGWAEEPRSESVVHLLVPEMLVLIRWFLARRLLGS